MDTQQENISSFIKANYGKKVFQSVRCLEREYKRLARFKNHRIFNLRCKNKEIIPVNLILECPVPTSRARRLLKRTSRILLSEQISHCSRIISKAERDIAIIKNRLQNVLPPEVFSRVCALAQSSGERIFSQYKDQQCKKFERRIVDSTAKVSTVHFVKNLTSMILTEDELTVLNLGQKFVISPKVLPVTDFIVGIEEMLHKLKSDKAEVIRAKIANLMITGKPPKCNLSHAEWKALRTLQRKAKDVLYLPADKGGGLVIMEKEAYNLKMCNLLSDPLAFRKLESFTVPAVFDRMVGKLKLLVDEGSLSYSQYLRLRPSTTVLPRIYGLPKIHKLDVPLRPIIATIGTVSSELASFLARIISPLVGKNSAHLRNSTEFLSFIKTVSLEEDEVLISFDVVSLFTSIPTDKAIQAVKMRLQEDETLEERTTLKVDDICDLLTFCVDVTYFEYGGDTYQQIFGAPMGSPISVILANIFMEDFEDRVLSCAPYEVRFWKRYMDDCCSAMKLSSVEDFLKHLNAQEPSINFTYEIEDNGCLPFLDINLRRTPDGRIATDVYRKPMGLGQYLNFRSFHPLSVKKGVVKSLMRRAMSYCDSPEAKDQEIARIDKDLRVCGYPGWFIKECISELENPIPTDPKEYIGRITIPFVDGTSQAIRRVLSKEGFQVTFKPMDSLKNKLVHPKEPIKLEDQDGVVYRIPCSECSGAYVGQTKNQLKTRLSQHKGAFNPKEAHTSAVASHAMETDHSFDWEHVEVKAVEKNRKRRLLKEAISIKLEENPLNRKHEQTLQLSSAWTPTLHQLKQQHRMRRPRDD